jgi:hypothetical protein
VTFSKIRIFQIWIDRKIFRRMTSLIPDVMILILQGRSDADYSPEGRDLSEALSLMSTFLTPKLMQPGAASASMTPTSTGPQAGSAQQNQQPIVPQQPAGFQQPMGFGQQQPGAFQQPMVNSQFPQQQGFMNQQVPLQQNVDPRMLSFGSQPAYGQGAYQQPSSLFNQPMPYLQARGMSNSPQPLTNVNAGQQALPTQGVFNGMSAQNLPPNFNNNQQQFVPSNQQFPSGNAMQG